jgi:SpoVK/Ycf46/Vps4 family AAA+-type ATPase
MCPVSDVYFVVRITGKTTVGKLLGKMLFEMGARRKDTFEVTTGEKLARMGADDVAKLIDKATDGSLFIDEAYALEPLRNASAAAVAIQLLDAAEAKRTELTIIMAGYKDDMETKLFDFNDGFNSRFNYSFIFEDYTKSELADILLQLCMESDWPPSDPSVIAVAAHRISRGRGHKAFGNARDVRKLFEKAYTRALARDRHAKTITMVDVMGPPPTREYVPDLGVAIDELDKMIGLESVKVKVHELVTLAKVNYDRELSGEEPYEVCLNRVFLGNPGTGKTTVAKLFGRILKGLGLLSDGTVELKQPSDLIGSHVGEAEKTTAALIKRCRGKVLLIDEAYALCNSSYGRNALDTLTGLVQGSPGEDIAVVLIGYEKDMVKMLRDQNAGLSRRFALEQAFRFEDFDNSALSRVLIQLITDSGLTASRQVRARLVKELGERRSRPNFGNAGEAVTMVASARQRLVARDPKAKELILSDFALDKPVGDGRAVLKGLCKIEHIIRELEELKAVVSQSERDGHDISQHLQSYVFVGNPGTGKTTIARLMAESLYDMGLLSVNKLVTCSGLDMQGSYVGQTKDKVNEYMADAQGGVLFIDEAYTLGSDRKGHNIFAQEALDQLVALMTEPPHLHKTVVILAGYKTEMERMISRGNVGLQSRFTGRIEFPDWDALDCVNGVSSRCKEQGILLAERVSAILLAELEEIKNRPGWANARDGDTMFRFLNDARAMRCSRQADLGPPQFTPEDVQHAATKLRKQRPFLDHHTQAADGNAMGIAVAPLTMMCADAAAMPSHVELSNIDVGWAGDASAVVELEEFCEESASPSDSEIYVYLLKACVDAGYDRSHETRQELIGVLLGVLEGGQFPDDILQPILEACGGIGETRVMRVLRPQVRGVLEGMQNAVRAEEERLNELKRLAEEERLEKEREHARVQERLRMSGLCPMGYSWHREGSGWRCAGGSHRVNDIDVSGGEM